MTPLSLLRRGRENDHTSPLLAALVLAMLDFSTTVGDTNAAAVSECFAAVIADSRQTLKLPTWSSFRQWSLPLAISQQDGGTDLTAPPACPLTPTLSAGLFARADLRDQTIAPIGAAVGQGSRTGTTVNPASTTGSRTMKTKSRIPTVKISIPPHSRKKQSFRGSTSPIEIEAGTGERPAAIIGPRDERSVSQTAAAKLFPPTPVGRSRREPVDPSNPLRRVLPQPGYDGESNRMNSTTTLALHGGECAYGCP